MPSLLVSSFIDPVPVRGSREYNALHNAEKHGTKVWFIGKYEDEVYFRAQTPKHERHVVVMWTDDLSGELLINCDCPAHRLRTGPDPCVHVGAVIKLSKAAIEVGAQLSTIRGISISDLSGSLVS